MSFLLFICLMGMPALSLPLGPVFCVYQFVTCEVFQRIHQLTCLDVGPQFYDTKLHACKETTVIRLSSPIGLQELKAIQFRKLPYYFESHFLHFKKISLWNVMIKNSLILYSS